MTDATHSSNRTNSDMIINTNKDNNNVLSRYTAIKDDHSHGGFMEAKKFFSLKVIWLHRRPYKREHISCEAIHDEHRSASNSNLEYSL